MRTHTNDFKSEISQLGRQISTHIYKYENYNIITENANNLITEDNLLLETDNINSSDKTLIDESLINSLSIIKNGQLFQSLMKEVDLEANYELKINDMINVQFGVLVNGAYEYLDYGNYIVYSKEYIAENKNWKYVCYDKMLYSMIPYEPLDVAYPCTINDYINALANKIGLTFADYNNSYANYDQLVLKELFKDKDLTYRDILDKLSEITGSNILIDDNDELKIGYVNITLETIEEDNIADTNINFGEKQGPFNKVVIKRTSDNYEYSYTSADAETFGITGQINIIDNEFAFNGHTDVIAQNINMYAFATIINICDFQTTGLCYFDYLDLIQVHINGEYYNTTILNNEITITQGIKEIIFNKEYKNGQKEQIQYTGTNINNIENKANKNEIITTINQSNEEIKIIGNRFIVEADNFKLDKDGTMTCNNAIANNLKIIGEGSTQGMPFVKFGDIDDVYAPYGTIIWDNGLTVLDYRGLEAPLIRTENNDGYAQLNGIDIECVGTVKSVAGICQGSKENLKKNFEKFDNALNIIKKIDIYKYNYKQEIDDTKKHIGFIIGDKYNYAKEITNNENESVDLYSFVSVCCKAIQEQQEEIETLQKRIKDLERKDK